MGLWSLCRSKLSRVVEEVFPFFHYLWRKVRCICLAKSEHILDKPQYEQYANLDLKKLQKRLREERQRASAMDEKTFKMTLSLSVGLTILGSVSVTLIKQVLFPEVRIVLGALIIPGFFYFLLSGFIALGALRTLSSYGYGTQHMLKLLELDSEEKQRYLAKCLARAEVINIVRHLRNETAYQSLRNGLILFFLAAMVFAGFLVLETLVPGWWESSTSTAITSSSGTN